MKIKTKKMTKFKNYIQETCIISQKLIKCQRVFAKDTIKFSKCEAPEPVVLLFPSRFTLFLNSVHVTYQSVFGSHINKQMCNTTTNFLIFSGRSFLFL